MDTSTLENIAEDYISHRLQKGGLLVAKPKNDRLGTDLLVFHEIDDGVKFCRVQAKGRSFATSNKTNIRIPKNYVTNGFVLFLYLEVSESVFESEARLYIFFPQEINQWSLTPNNEYQLNLSLTNYEEKLKSNRFSLDKINQLKIVIKTAEIHGEFKRMAFITANQLEEGDTQQAHITVG